MSIFVPATKFGTKLRTAIFGPSGSGKTFTALRMAKGIGVSIASICTERQSMRKYADWFTFDVCDLEDRTPEGYLRAVRAASAYDILIVDTLTHAWQETLTEHDKTAQTKFRGNTWSAWSETRPKQRAFIDELLSIPQHLIVTMRSKTEWQTVNENGKVKPVRVGLTPEQDKGIEFEFDQLIELSQDHVATVIKDRSGKYQDAMIEKPGEDFGRDLAAWLADGDEPPPVTTIQKTAPATAPARTRSRY